VSVVSSGEPSPWVWLRHGVDRLFHAVSVWELPPGDEGPTAELDPCPGEDGVEQGGEPATEPTRVAGRAFSLFAT